ncbi:MAG: hypothetical protein ACI4QI_04010 [Candidatus Coproplasma sp.]
MDKLRFMRLWDLYGGLLTDTQREITDMYFNLDLTVSEIAEQKGISRQGVSDCLNICRKELAGYEDRLGHDKLLSEGDRYVSFLLTDVGRWADKFLLLHPEYAEDIAALREILERDYSEEIADD